MISGAPPPWAMPPPVRTDRPDPGRLAAEHPAHPPGTIRRHCPHCRRATISTPPTKERT